MVTGPTAGSERGELLDAGGIIAAWNVSAKVRFGT